MFLNSMFYFFSPLSFAVKKCGYKKLQHYTWEIHSESILKVDPILSV